MIHVDCYSLFPADNVWYRGYVEKKRSADQMRKVVFIDFGNWQKSTLNMLRPFKQEFTQIPAQAVLCGLDGKQPNGSWSLLYKTVLS